MYRSPAAVVQFGDLLSADWFHSAYVRKDARSLMAGPAGRRGANTWVEADPAPGNDLLLAHGRPMPVVVLSDPCEIESVLKHRGGNRLLVAGITEWDERAAALHRENRMRDFRRHLLPPADGYAGGVVHFGALFMVVDKAVGDARRDWSLERAAQVNLEVAWEAYAVRRGPRAVADNTRKLAAVLTALGDHVIAGDVMEGLAPVAEAADAARAAIEEALGVAWDIEGALLNDVSDTLEVTIRGEHSPDELGAIAAERQDALRNALQRLAVSAAQAAIMLGGQPGEGPEALTA